MFIQFVWVPTLLIRQSGDFEINPEPRPNPCQSFSICHWNLSSLTAHNYLKVSLLRVYVAIKNLMLYVYQGPFLIRLTYLMITILIFLPTPIKCKKGGVCIYFKISLPLKALDIQLLQECINFEIKIATKHVIFSLGKDLSVNPKMNLNPFVDKLELNLDSTAFRNPYLIVVYSDFNTQTKEWYPLCKTTYEGTKIDGITSQFVLEQLIHEPNHIIGEGLPE